MKRNNWLLISLAIAGLAMGCGDDDVVTDAGGGGDTTPPMDGDTPEDTGTAEVMCPPDSPDPDTQMGPCCARMSNADRTDAPEFRISGLNITTPASLDSPVIKGLLQTALNDESFNWAIDITNAGADGEVNITTGFAERQADGTLTFQGAGGDFPPSMTTATLTGDTLVAESLADTVIVPVVNAETGEPEISLPLQSLTLSMATWDADRTCIGNVAPNGMVFDTEQAQLSAYITIEDAAVAELDVGVVNTLCNVLRGSLADTTDCTTVDQAEWMVQPDGLCTDGTCTNECDGATTCNAWLLSGGFAAQGIEIND